MFSVMDKTTKAIPVCDDPDVITATAEVEKAEAALRAAQDAEGCALLLTRPPFETPTNRPAIEDSPIDRALAAADVPALTAARLRAEAGALRLRQAHAAAAEAARGRLDTARHAARQPLLREVFKKLGAAEEAAEAIRAFDAETERMGGRYVSPPCPELLSGIGQWQEDVARREHMLDE